MKAEVSLLHASINPENRVGCVYFSVGHSEIDKGVILMNEVTWFGLTGIAFLGACSTSFQNHTQLVNPGDEDDRGSGRIAA